METHGTTTVIIEVEYDAVRISGRLTLVGQPASAIWDRLVSRVIDEPDGRELGKNQIELPWTAVLCILRDFGSKHQQLAFGFRFKPIGQAVCLAKRFSEEMQRVRASQRELTQVLTPAELERRLVTEGFTKRRLRSFQVRDLLRLLSLSHGANFSVPGAGKTTVTFALHVLTRKTDQHFFVVGPKTAFPAWCGVIDECIDSSTDGVSAERFTMLNGSENENDERLRSGATRFLMSYDLMVRQQSMLAAYFSRQAVHLVLDEAHRMKAGLDSQRGAFLLNVAPLLVRRDILTGTPMPQGPQDLASQLQFLWPAQGLEQRLQRGEAPRAVLGQLYVRTTKSELGLPKVRRQFFDVEMAQGQQALYGVVRNETLRQLAAAIRGGRESADFISARRSVMRLLQLSVNPTLALKSISEDFAATKSGLIDAVLDEGVSLKMRAVTSHARSLADENKKVVIWTIFTENILELENLLADLNPVTLYGAVPSGLASDLSTREGRLRRFHEDSLCKVLIANPAAAGEGISLHTVCHDAIYLDRSYVSTHYLQSIDRIHRLGLAPGTETNVFVYRTKAPAQLGSIDYSVSRRLAKKIRELQQLLDDTDLHEIAFDEEAAGDPTDYSVDLQDLVDLVEELEGKVKPDSEGEDAA